MRKFNVLLITILSVNICLGQLLESHYYSMRGDVSLELIVVSDDYKVLKGVKSLRLLNEANLQVDTFSILSPIQNVVVLSTNSLSVSGIMESYILTVSDTGFQIQNQIKYGPEYGFPFLTMLNEGFLGFTNKKNGSIKYNIVFLPVNAEKPNPDKAKTLLPFTKSKRIDSDFLPTRFQYYRNDVLINVPTQGYAILYDPTKDRINKINYLEERISGFIFSDLKDDKLYYCAFDKGSSTLYELYTRKKLIELPYKIQSVNNKKIIYKKTGTNEYHSIKI